MPTSPITPQNPGQNEEFVKLMNDKAQAEALAAGRKMLETLPEIKNVIVLIDWRPDLRTAPLQRCFVSITENKELLQQETPAASTLHIMDLLGSSLMGFAQNMLAAQERKLFELTTAKLKETEKPEEKETT